MQKKYSNWINATMIQPASTKEEHNENNVSQKLKKYAKTQRSFKEET